MTRHEVRRGAARAAVVVAVAAVGAWPGVALAAEPPETGWWTSTPVALAPDGDGSLVVQGGPGDAPVAYAAVAFDVAAGEAPVRLSLTVEDGSLTTPDARLRACPLVEEFEPAHGGRIEEAPEYDCTSSAVAAPSGTTYSFYVRELPWEGRFAVALLPTSASDRVALVPPGAEALEVDAAGAVSRAPAAAASGPSTPAPPRAGVPAVAPARPAPFTPPSNGTAPTTAAPATAPDVGAADGGSAAGERATGAAPVSGAPVAAATGGGGASAPRVAVAVGLVIIAAGLWLSVGRGDLGGLEGGA